jgi:hypothetical protein
MVLSLTKESVMRMHCVIVAVVLCALVSSAVEAQTIPSEASGSGCLTCHSGIEPIRETGSDAIAVSSPSARLAQK